MKKFAIFLLAGLLVFPGASSAISRENAQYLSPESMFSSDEQKRDMIDKAISGISAGTDLERRYIELYGEDLGEAPERFPGDQWVGAYIGAQQRLIIARESAMTEGGLTARLNLWLAKTQRDVLRELMQYPAWVPMFAAVGAVATIRAVYGVHHAFDDLMVIQMVNSWPGNKYQRTPYSQLHDLISGLKKRIEVWEAQKIKVAGGIGGITDTLESLESKIDRAKEDIFIAEVEIEIKHRLDELAKAYERGDSVQELYDRVQAYLWPLREKKIEMELKKLGLQIQELQNVVAPELFEHLRGKVHTCLEVVQSPKGKQVLGAERRGWKARKETLETELGKIAQKIEGFQNVVRLDLMEDLRSRVHACLEAVQFAKGKPWLSQEETMEVELDELPQKIERIQNVLRASMAVVEKDAVAAAQVDREAVARFYQSLPHKRRLAAELMRRLVAFGTKGSPIGTDESSMVDSAL